MLFVEPLQYARDAVTFQNVRRDRQGHFKSLTGITYVDFEFAADVGVIDAVGLQLCAGLLCHFLENGDKFGRIRGRGQT